MNECKCSRPTEAYVCLECLDDLARALRDVPWLDDELDVTITKQRGIPTTGGSASRETALPWHEAAAEARRHLRALLVSWVKFCDEEHVRVQQCEPGLPADTMTAMSRWMLLRVDGLGLIDIGPDAVEEITDAVDACRKVIDRRPDREFVGRCECGRNLEREPGASMVRCRSCGAEHDAEAKVSELWGQVAGLLVTAREGVALLKRCGITVKQDTVDKWREREKITERSHNADGHRLYLFDDLRTVAMRHAHPTTRSA